MRRPLAMFVLASMTVAGGCKAKDAAPSMAAAGSGSAPAAPAPTARTVEPAPAATAEQGYAGAAPTLAAGAPTFGCFGWSERQKAAACITGERDDHSPDTAAYALTFIGGQTPPLGLGAAIDAATATKANTMLRGGGFSRLDARAMPLSPGKAAALAPDVTVVWRRKQTARGGDNQPPTHDNRVTARCRGKDVPVLRDESEGGDPSISVRSMGDSAIIEMRVAVAREGERSEHAEAAVLDVTACTVRSSAAAPDSPPTQPAAGGAPAPEPGTWPADFDETAAECCCELTRDGKKVHEMWREIKCRTATDDGKCVSDRHCKKR